jgi:hypothetical protein
MEGGRRPIERLSHQFDGKEIIFSDQIEKEFLLDRANPSIEKEPILWPLYDRNMNTQYGLFPNQQPTGAVSVLYRSAAGYSPLFCNFPLNLPEFRAG